MGSMRSLNNNQQNGSILLALVIMLPFIILIAALYTNLTVSGIRLGKRDQSHTDAQLAADAGVDAAMEAYNQDNLWAGTGSALTLQNDSRVKTTYEVSISDVDDNTKRITSIGRAYRPPNDTAPPEATVKLNVDIRAVRSGNFSVVSGVGGLVMSNSAKIVNGNVYVNGTITMSNSAQIGLSFSPVDVKVAHQSCPVSPDTSYPRVCAAGENGQPVSITNPAHIYGEVQATNQTDGSGMSNSGLVLGSSPPPISLPDYDRGAQQAAVTAANTITGESASCSSGTKTWAANTKITGDVTISNVCNVTVEGNVWITGKLLIRNSGQLIVKNGLSTPPVIMIDGQDGLTMRNSATILPNTGSVGLRIITYWSADASCSPDCTDVTGLDLKNSQSVPTIDIDNASNGAQTEFYARWSKLTAGNGGAIGALAGQTVELKNSLAVTFGTSVTGVGETIWVIDSYRRVF